MRGEFHEHLMVRRNYPEIPRRPLWGPHRAFFQPAVIDPV